MKKIFIVLSALLATTAFAAKGPIHKSTRALGMGNAHIAVVDDKEAIYYNYAGLNQINRLGNYDMRPRMGYYPDNYLDMRLNIGSAGGFDKFMDAYKTSSHFVKLYNRANKAAKANDLNTADVFLDSLAARPDLADELNSFDHNAINSLVKLDAELAFHNFGGAFWAEGHANPYIDGGLLIPMAGIDTFYVDAVAQLGGAYGLTDNFMVGAGFKIVNRNEMRPLLVGIENYKSVKDTLSDRFADEISFTDIAYGMDFGILWQATRVIRIGASARNVFFNELNGKVITPNIGVGIDYSPLFFNRNTAYARKMNIAMDYDDILDDEKNYKPLSHLNFGLEFEQVLLAWPGYENTYRVLKLRLAGGFKGGYPTAGVGLEVLRFAELEFVTWADEEGYYTGDKENRYYMLQVSFGM